MINYDKYLKRLRQKRSDSPYWQAYRRSLSSVSNDTKAMSNSLNGLLDRSGGSVAAVAQAGQDSQERVRDISNQLYTSYSEKEAARRDEIDSRIDTLEFARDRELEAEAQRLKAEKEAKRSGLGKSIMQIGGTLLGAGIGVASAGTMAPLSAGLIGASIGGGIGEMGGSFIGGNGKMALDNINPEELMSGLGNTISGISSAVTLGEEEQLMEDMQSDLVPFFNDLPSSDQAYILSLTQSGNLRGALNYVRKISMRNQMDSPLSDAEREAYQAESALVPDKYSWIWR